MEKSSNKIGKYITELRKKKGYSQKELGDKLFVSNNTISKWERGSLLPDIENIKKLAEVLDTDVERIIYGENKSIKKSKKYITIMLIIISLITFCLLTIKIVKNHYKWTIKNFDNTQTYSNVQIYGQIATNMEKTIIYVKFLSVDNMHYGTDLDLITDNYKLQFLYKEKIIYEEVGEELPPRSISKIFEHYTSNYEIKRIDESDYDKIELRIATVIDGNSYIYSIKPAEYFQ